MLKDKAGREIKEGALVDVQMLGLFNAIAIKVVDSPIEIPGQPPKPPHLVLQIVLHEFSPDGVHVPTVHLLRNPKEQEATGLIQ